jgi:hypothetical protein
VNIEGMVVSSGLGTTLAAFDNGAHLASTGYLWTGADFA